MLHQPILTHEQQLYELATLIDDIHIRKGTTATKNAPYTTSDYVTWKLNQIFTPAGWDLEIRTGPDIREISDGTAIVQVVVRITVRFADGSTAYRDDVGAWPIYGPRPQNAGDVRLLERADPTTFEHCAKAAVSDGMKAAAERLGAAFRPMVDKVFEGWLRRTQSYNHSQAHPDPNRPKDANEAIAQLFPDAGDNYAGKRTSGNGTAQIPEIPSEYANLEQPAARQKFYTLSSPAMRDEKISLARVQELAELANSSPNGWIDSLIILESETA